MENERTKPGGAARSSSTTFGSLGILDLGNLSDFSVSSSLITGADSEIKDKLLKLKEYSQSNCSSTITSNLVNDNKFKIPDTSITNALLTKRIFPMSSNNSSNKTRTEVLSGTKETLSANISVNSEWKFRNSHHEAEINSINQSSNFQSMLDSKYLRPCSDAEWRVSSVGNGYFKNSSIINNIFPNPAETHRQESFSTEGLPTPFKGSQSIVGQNKSMNKIDVKDSINFRNDQISARSSSLSGSGSARTFLGSSSSNPSSNTLKFGQSTLSGKTSSSSLKAPILTMVKNPFDVSNPANDHNKENISWLPPDAHDFGYPANQFGIANNGFDEEHFFSEDDAKNLLQQDEIEFQKEQQFKLPENVSIAAEVPENSFFTFKNDLSLITRPSFCSSSIFGGEVPEKITKEMLFRAKSDQLGKLNKTSNSQRPFFGLSVESPLQVDESLQTNEEPGISSITNSANERLVYVEKLIRDLRVEETPVKANNEERNSFDEFNSIPSTSGIGSMSKEFRSQSASEVEKPNQRDEIRKFHSMENLSPTKKMSRYPENFGSHPSLSHQIPSTSYGFCPSNPAPNFATPHYNQMACFQCYDAARANYVTPQMHLPCPLASYPRYHPMGVPFPNTSPCSYPTNEIIRGPEEISVYACWGSNAKVIIPLINSSQQVLSCSFNLVTAFMGNSKVNSDALGLVMPGNYEILPRTSKDSTISLLAVEEGVTNIWIEIETLIPRVNTTTGSFTCHIKLVVEKPNIDVEICDKQAAESIVFNIQSPNRDIETKFIKIKNDGKAMVPLIVFLESKNAEGFTFMFPEQTVKEEMQNSVHFFKMLSPSILIYHAKGSNGSSIKVPVTVFTNRSSGFDGYFELRGTITIGLECPNKIDENPIKISLLARIGFSKITPRIDTQFVAVASTELKSSTDSSSLSRKGLKYRMCSLNMNKSTNTSQNYEKEIPERDTTTMDSLSDSRVTTFNEAKWYLEPENVTFAKCNEKGFFNIHNTSDNPMWFNISEKSGTLNFSPLHGVCHKNSNVSVTLKTKSQKNAECQIKVTCDGLDKYVKVLVTGFP